MVAASLVIDKPAGIVQDIPATNLPPNVWSDGANVRFSNGTTKKRGGQLETLYAWSFAQADPSPANTGAGTLANISSGPSTIAEVITLTATNATTFTVTGATTGSIGTATVGTAFSSAYINFTINNGSPAFVAGDNFAITATKVAAAANINHVLPWETPADNYWVWASLTGIYRWNGSTHTDVSRTVGGAYTADANKPWTSCILGDVAIMNNGVDLPQYMGTGGTDFENFPTGTSNWVSTVRCKSMRAFKQYLVALNITDGASYYPQNVRWSTAADPGSLPYWDITDPTLECGENTLSETDGEVIDGLALGDSFIIYKTDGVYGMQLIGGQFVMRFYNIFNDVGILGVNCVTAYPGGHFVVSGHDIYVHNGTSKQSVISGVVRDTIYQRISDTYITRSFCVSDYKNKEALFCYVKAGTTATYPNEALVWNWESNTITFRDLPGTAHIAYGLIEEAPEETEQWNPDSQSWDNDTTQWGETAGKPTQRRLLIPDTTGRKFYAEGRGSTDGGTSYRSWVERTGLDGGDPTTIKHVYQIIPTMKGSGSVDFYIGGEYNPGSGTVWYGPYTYTIGTTYHIPVSVGGRRIAIRIDSTDEYPWEVTSIVLNGQIVGRY